MFKTILVPLDLSEIANLGRPITTALELARQHGADVRFLTVLEPVPAFVESQLSGDLREKRQEEAEKMLDELSRRGGETRKASCAVRWGSIYQEILHEAEECGADLVVMESHRPSMSTYLLGSNAARVVRHASCSVLVLRGS